MDLILHFADVETTGLDPVKNGLTQIAFTIDILREDGTLEPQEAYNTQVKPFEGKDLVSTKALEVQGLELKDLKAFPDPTSIYIELNNIYSKYINKYDKKNKMVFLGYNGKFDYDFMRSFFTKHKDPFFGSWFWFPPVDIMTLSFDFLLKGRHNLPDFKLHTVAGEMGIALDKNKLHDAMYDIELAKEIYLIIKRKRGEIK